jgi:cyclopropane fatty-acyl-phospholipid synthase-like methyltransferase
MNSSDALRESTHISAELRSRLAKPAFPRSSTYDAKWMLDTNMGPNVLWLAEWASQVVPLHEGMRVLDLGCGKATSSIFLAKEFGATVWAVDLWIKPTDNWGRIKAADVADRVLPLHAEAHALPFAADYFDAILSFDAYHYFGTDDLYLGYISKFLRQGGHLAIVVPGLARELPQGPPETVRPYWEWDYCSFHSPEWWRKHWAKTGLVEIEVADSMADGWQLWAEWDECCAEVGAGAGGGSAAARAADLAWAEMLRQDQGQLFGFTRVVARRPAR